MRKIINGARYDTDTAKKLGHWESGEDCREFSYYEESLYRTKAGKYFIHGAGNAASPYARISDDRRRGGEQIIAASEDAARKWAEEKLDADDYESIFGEIAEGEYTPVSVLVPPDIMAKLDAEKAASSRNRTDIVLAALREYLK